MQKCTHYVSVVFFAIVLSGCGASTKDVIPAQAALMPPAIATNIISSVFGQTWAESPSVEASGDVFCRHKFKDGEIVGVDYKEFKYISDMRGNNGWPNLLALSASESFGPGTSCYLWKKFSLPASVNLKDLVSALNSRGAQITVVYHPM